MTRVLGDPSIATVAREHTEAQTSFKDKARWRELTISEMGSIQSLVILTGFRRMAV
jgi:hypothetical protein